MTFEHEQLKKAFEDIKEENIALKEENSALKKQILELKGNVELKTESINKKDLNALKTLWKKTYERVYSLKYNNFLPKEVNAFRKLLTVYGYDKAVKIIEYGIENFDDKKIFKGISAFMPTPNIIAGWSRTIEQYIIKRKEIPSGLGY